MILQDPHFSSFLLLFVTPSAKIIFCDKENLVLQTQLYRKNYLLFSAACAAASLAIGTRNGEQDT